MGKNQQPKGIYIDLLRALNTSKDTQIEFRGLPHGRGVRELIFGYLDMALLTVMPGHLELPADTSQIIITDQPVMERPLNFYSASRRQLVIDPLDNIHTLDQLHHLHHLQLGFVRVGRNKIHSRLQGLDNVVLFSSHESMVKSLLGGRIDLAALDPFIADYWEKNCRQI